MYRNHMYNYMHTCMITRIHTCTRVVCTHMCMYMRISPSSSAPSSNPIVQPKSIKKRQRYSVEFKRKILHMLETNTQQKVEELVNIDRRVIGRWAKETNKTKINNCIGTRSTYKIFDTRKGWWLELEALSMVQRSTR